MNQHISRVFFIILLAGIITGSKSVYAQNIPMPTGIELECIKCGAKARSGSSIIHYSSCPYYARASGTSSGKSGSASNDIQNMIVGTVVQSLISAIFSSTPANNQKELEAQQRAAELAAQQAAENQRIKEEQDQAAYEKMMGSYKLMEGSLNLKTKTLTDANLGFKTLDGDAEALEAGAREQFDNISITHVSGSSEPGIATPFFGDTMALENIQILLDPEKNPNIVDLREARKYVAEKTQKDSLDIVTCLRKYESDGNGEPIIQKPDCIQLERQLKGYMNQRQQFRKTIDLSYNELTIWETANRNALMNAAKDGVEYFTGQLLESLANRVKSADRLQLILDKNAKQMAKEGISITEIQAKIDALRALSTAGQIAEFTSNMSDWQTFVKDGISSLIGKLSGSNIEIKSMLEDPTLKKYFETEAPELNTLLDISKIAASNKVFGKWVANKIPVIGAIEISIKQSYNAFDYFLSLNRILKAQKINGGVEEAARYIQKKIDNTYLALNECPDR